jgi:hypothetical protein
MRAYTQVRRAIGYVRFEHVTPTSSRRRRQRRKNRVDGDRDDALQT